MRVHELVEYKGGRGKAGRWEAKDTHDCGGVETWEENEAVDILGQERQNTYRDTALVTWTPPHNKTLCFA